VCLAQAIILALWTAKILDGVQSDLPHILEGPASEFFEALTINFIGNLSDTKNKLDV
jgi:hypothetical protein